MKKGVNLILISIVLFTLFSIHSVLADGLIITCGGTISSSGTYNMTADITVSSGNCINIDADNVVLDGKGFSITGDNSGNLIYVYGQKNVTIKDFKNISHGYYGIVIEHTNNSFVYNVSTDSSATAGVYLANSRNNTISNIRPSNEAYGILTLENSNGNIFTNITSTNNTNGIVISGSTNNQLTNIDSLTDNLNIFVKTSSNNTLISNAEIVTPRGFGIEIQDSINNTVNNITITNAPYSAIYASYSSYNRFSNITISNFSTGIYLSTSSNNLITNLNSSNAVSFGSGISMNRMNHTNISDSYFYNNYYGIYSSYSMGGHLTNNRVIGNNGGNGISFYISNETTLVNNTVESNNRGVYSYFSSILNMTNNTANNNSIGFELSYPRLNTLVGNSINNNTRNFYFLANSEDHFDNTIDTTNTVDNGYKIYFNYSIEDYTFNITTSPEAGLVVCGNCSNITITDLNLSHNNDAGIYLYTTNNSIIRNITSNNNGRFGIDLGYSNNNQISNSTIINNGDSGINVGGVSSNNIFQNSALYGNFLGLKVLSYSNNNTFTSLYLSSNTNYSVSISNYAYQNNFHNNTYFNNTNGILLTENSHDNNFTGEIINYSINNAITFSSQGYPTGPTNNTFVNIQILNTNASHYDVKYQDAGINKTTFIDMVSIGNYSFYKSGVTIKNSTHGEINFFSLNGTGSNLSNDIIIGNNSAFVNSAGNSGLSTSSNVTFYGIGDRSFSNPAILKDGYTCTDCTEFTSLTANNVIFSVGSWSNYTIGERNDLPVENVEETSSSGGGGGFPLLRISETQLEEGYNNIMYKNWRISFKIENEIHTFKVENINENSVDISISSETKEATISSGEENRFDLSGDNVPDFLVKINSLNQDSYYPSANITIQKINEEILASPSDSEKADLEPVSQKTNKPDFRIVLFIIVILIGIIVFYFYRKQNTSTL